MKESLLLLSKFIKNPKEVGAITPSSAFLRKEIVDNINFETAHHIVELGPGLGAFTQSILENARRDTKMICFETNKDFCEHLGLKIKDPRLRILNVSAEQMQNQLREMNIKKVDCIVSGLPLFYFSDTQREQIMSGIKAVLPVQGTFILFQYTQRLQKLLESHFETVEKKLVLGNLPPAFVYVCRDK
ncbi:TPA: SAM-dependent methyltransferase [Candidatus Woesearchaeota archaeon]|nr:SAM-dependent methyltransferase [Candidatus Woesearchaeota archaeon]